MRDRWNDITADLKVSFVVPQLPDADPYVVLDLTKGKMPITLSREQARDLAHLILERLE